MYIRRALGSPQLHIPPLMLCRSHLELMEKTESGLISLKKLYVPDHCFPGVCTLMCRRLHARVRLFD